MRQRDRTTQRDRSFVQQRTLPTTKVLRGVAVGERNLRRSTARTADSRGEVAGRYSRRIDEPGDFRAINAAFL